MKKLLCLMLAMLMVFTLCACGKEASQDKGTETPKETNDNPLFQKGLLAVCLNGKYGYVNEQGNFVIQPQLDMANNFTENGLAPVKQNGKWGYINKSGVTAIGFDFGSVSELDVMGENIAFSFRNGLAPVKKGDYYGIVTTSGESVVNFVFQAIIQGENGKYLAVIDNTQCVGCGVCASACKFGAIEKGGND